MADFGATRRGNPHPRRESQKSAVLSANSYYFFPFRLKYCCFAMPYRRGYGLPRRFAPRNDMLKFAVC